MSASIDRTGRTQRIAATIDSPGVACAGAGRASEVPRLYSAVSVPTVDEPGQALAALLSRQGSLRRGRLRRALRGALNLDQLAGGALNLDENLDQLGSAAP